jgi:hypothetical protein
LAECIHIVDTPKGDAPLWVREQWVGLILPLAHGEAFEAYAGSVFEPPRQYSRLEIFWRVFTGKWKQWRGFLVDVDPAVSILEAKSPEAAAWWRTNTPHLLGSQFMFDYGCCDPLDADPSFASSGDPANDA